AVPLRRFYATARPGARAPVQEMWSKRLLWGTHMLRGGFMMMNANAFRLGTTWGEAFADDGQNIVWGTTCGDGGCDNIVWGTSTSDDNIVWGTFGSDDNIVWGTAAGDDNIVWGTDCGGADCENIV